MLDQILKGSETEPGAGTCLVTPANEPGCEEVTGLRGDPLLSMNQFRAGNPKEIPSFLRHAAGFCVR